MTGFKYIDCNSELVFQTSRNGWNVPLTPSGTSTDRCRWRECHGQVCPRLCCAAFHFLPLNLSELQRQGRQRETLMNVLQVWGLGQ